MSRDINILLFTLITFIKYVISVDFRYGTLQVSSTWQIVQFTDINDPIPVQVNGLPVVIALPASYNDFDPAIPQIKDVTRTQFSIRIIEPKSANPNAHLNELVSYMVVEPTNDAGGFGYLPPLNRAIRSGIKTVSVDINNLNGNQQNFDTIALTEFDTVPACLAQTQTTSQVFANKNGGGPDPDRFLKVKSEVKLENWASGVVNDREITMALESEQSNLNGNMQPEQVGWICFDRSAIGEIGYIENIKMYSFIERTGFVVADSSDPYSKTYSLSTEPTAIGISTALAYMNSRVDSNAAFGRRELTTNNREFKIFVQEETTQGNQQHDAEAFSLHTIACGVTDVDVELPYGPIKNKHIRSACPLLHFKTNVGSGSPYVTYNITIISGVTPKIYLRQNEPTSSNTIDNDISLLNPTLSSSNSILIDYINPPLANLYLGIETESSYSLSIQINKPPTTTIKFGLTNCSSTTSQWKIFKLTLTTVYSSVLFIVKPDNISVPYKLYVQSLNIPTTLSFSQSSDILEENSYYSVGTGPNPAINVDWFIGVYTPNTDSASFCISSEPGAKPSIQSITPSAGATFGGTVQIIGFDFGDGSDLTILFGTDECIVDVNSLTVLSGSQLQVLCDFPAGDGSDVPVTATHFNRTSTSKPFDYFPPTLSSVTQDGNLEIPTTGGLRLSITGTNFGRASSVSVTVNNVNCPIDEASHINAATAKTVCIAPPGQGLNQVLRMVVNQQTATPDLSVDYEAPILVDIIPNTGPASGGTNVTILGRNFGSSISAIEVRIDSKKCTPIYFFNQTTIICATPPGQGGDLIVTLTVSGEPSPSTELFSYFGPVITSISPTNTTTNGGLMIIKGENFGTTEPVVNFGTFGAECNVQTYNDSIITCIIPAGEGLNFPISVSRVSQTSNDNFKFSYNPPTITRIEPVGLVPTTGGTITIIGKSFGTLSASVVVEANEEGCTVTDRIAHSIIECTVTAGQGKNKNVKVTVAGQPSNIFKYSYKPPIIFYITPTNGPTAGSTAITVYGESFGSFGSVRINNLPCTLTGIEYTQTQIECLTPPGQGRNQTVKVISGGQESNTTAFNYNPPTIESTTTSGPTQGGTIFTIKGNSMGTSGDVKIGGKDCIDITTFTDTLIECTLPPGSGSNLPVAVIVEGVNDTVYTFSYNAPTLISILPQEAITDSNDIVVITGSSFDSSGTVIINNIIATCNPYDDEEITCILPDGQGIVQVQVISQDNKKSINNITYEYSKPLPLLAKKLSAPTNGNGTLIITGSSFGTFDAIITIGQYIPTRYCSPILVQNHTTIICKLPAGVGTSQSIGITVSTLQSTNAIFFDYDPPDIDTLYPPPGTLSTSGGELLTLNGKNFGADGEGTISISVGEGICDPITYRNHTQIICEMPAGTGVVLVRISIANQLSNSKSYSYAGPTLNRIIPNTGIPTKGQINLILLGKSFGNTGATITINSNQYTPIEQNNTYAKVLIPAGTGKNVPVFITVAGVPSETKTYSYLPPTMLSINPKTATTLGQVEIEIIGTNFGTDFTKASLTIGGTTCPLIASDYKQTSMNCTLQAGSGKDLDVLLSVDSQSSTNKLNFSYNAPFIILFPTFIKMFHPFS